MTTLSKFGLTIFEIANELFIAISSGVLGLAMLLDRSLQNNSFLNTLAVLCVTGSCFVYVFQSSDRRKPAKEDIIFISGCDSGLGFSLAQQCSDMGFTVMAGFLSLESKGANELRSRYGEKILQVTLDITDTENIQQVVKYVEMYLGTHKDHRLYALVNNAGVMVFGEFEWLTERLLAQQINVNLLGTTLLTKAFCPLMRKYKGRIITITSHCAQANLPGLSVYGATKAALASWSDGLRVELGKYGIKVITFIPGSFTTQSNIMANHMKNAFEMHESFTREQHSFYANYFKSYNTYLSFISAPNTPKKIDDFKLYRTFENALLEEFPKSTYKTEPFRYSVYHFLFRHSPIFLRDYLVVKFMQMPEYSVEKKDISA